MQIFHKFTNQLIQIKRVEMINIDRFDNLMYR